MNTHSRMEYVWKAWYENLESLMQTVGREGSHTDKQRVKALLKACGAQFHNMPEWTKEEGEHNVHGSNAIR